MDKKWVAIWGAASSYAERGVANYAKNFTLRFTHFSTLDGEAVKIHLSNLLGESDVTLTRASIAICGENAYVAKSGSMRALTFNGSESVKLERGKKVVSDVADITVKRGEKLLLSLYFEDFTCLDNSVANWGPLHNNSFAVGDFTGKESFDINVANGLWSFYFVDTIELLTAKENRSVIAFGDSITAQSWPEQLVLKLCENGKNIGVVRRAISGSRVLRQYDCIQYRHYGPRGLDRVEHELDVEGVDTVVVLHGVNDLIHPGDGNPFRPMSDFPTADELIAGFKKYIDEAHKRGLKIYLCTILPIEGWRTYAAFRNDVRVAVNEWLRTQTEADGVIDLDAELRQAENPDALLPEYDSGDHLHPSYEGATKIAELVYNKIV